MVQTVESVEVVLPMTAEDKKVFIYLSDCATAELNITTSFLSFIFGRDVHVYFWSANELRSILAQDGYDPFCIIFSQPFTFGHRGTISKNEVWNIVRGFFPETPMIWLSPDSNDTPTFFLKDKLTRVIVTEDGDKLRLIERLVGSITSFTGIAPLIDLKLKKR